MNSQLAVTLFDLDFTYVVARVALLDMVAHSEQNAARQIRIGHRAVAYEENSNTLVCSFDTINPANMGLLSEGRAAADKHQGAED